MHKPFLRLNGYYEEELKFYHKIVTEYLLDEDTIYELERFYIDYHHSYEFLYSLFKEPDKIDKTIEYCKNLILNEKKYVDGQKKCKEQFKKIHGYYPAFDIKKDKKLIKYSNDNINNLLELKNFIYQICKK